MYIGESIRTGNSTFSYHSKCLFLETISEWLHFVGKRILEIMNRFYWLGFFFSKNSFWAYCKKIQPPPKKKIQTKNNPSKKRKPYKVSNNDTYLFTKMAWCSRYMYVMQLMYVDSNIVFLILNQYMKEIINKIFYWKQTTQNYSK